MLTEKAYRIAGKFGGLAVYLNNRQIKIRQHFLLAYIRMAIPYQTAKLKSANTFAMAIWDPTAKFNSRQYFQLYGSIIALINNYVIVSITSTLHFSPETNFDYILTALGYSYPSEVPSLSMAASVGPTAVELMSLISQVKEVLSHLGDGFIRVSWY